MNKLSTAAKRRLFIAVTVVFSLIVTAFIFCVNITQTVALEQEVRCGMAEHIHTDECYTGDILTCEIPEHTHNSNCYLVLLNENDVNGVLEQIDKDDSRSLENTINNVVDTALQFNSALNGQSEELLASESETVNTQNSLVFNSRTVAELNNTIKSEDSIPNILLNENINTRVNPPSLQAVSNENADRKSVQSLSEKGSSGTSPLSVGDTPSVSANTANFYIYLDGSWQCIGSTSFTTPYANRTYTATVQNTNMLNLINNALGTEYDTSSFSLYYAASATSNRWTKATIGTSATTFGSNRNQNMVSAAKYVRIVAAGAAGGTSTAFAFNTVTYVYPDGNTEVKYVRSGTSVNLPEGNYIWTDDSGNTYEPGTSATIRAKTTFTAQTAGPITSAIINYNINFPAISGVTVATVPTISGTSSTTLVETISENISITLRNVSQKDVEGSINGNSTGLSRMVHFSGWRVGRSDIILSPNTSLTWNELLAYAPSGTLNLTAVWEYDARQTASFFIRFDSVAVDTDGNITGQDSNRYTKELFASFVGGIDMSKTYSQLNMLYNIADTSSDNSYTADQEIRALYGPKSDGVYLNSFPNDDYIFEQLKSYASYLEVDGKPVDVNDLHSNAYAIRWYVFKCQSDAWHIDGKLVRKEGTIHVQKTFAGNKELIEKAKKGFYIDAYNENEDVHTTLDLNNYTSCNTDTQTYLWEVTDVDYGELWTITEHPNTLADEGVEFNVYSDYSVVDSADEQSKTGMGTSMTVSGVTYALDDDTTEVLRAEFTNIYNKNDSIVIKKQDSRTGVSIGGATFRLLQNGQPLRFDYNEQTESYVYNQSSGIYTTLSGSNNGYFEISIDDFSYDNGPITVREITAPQGYAPIGDIVIGYTDEDSKTVGIISGDTEMAKYYSGILIVGNSADITSATVQKEWDCPETEWDDVTVQLLANGRLITTLVSGVAPSVTLNSDNNWTYTWDNLPVYINGEKITYSVREIKVGDELCKPDYSFVNWLVSYDSPVYTTDEDGNTNVFLNITNTTKRVLLRLTKMDAETSARLGGAVFLLEALNSDGEVDAGEIAKTLTTADNGTLTFDNLKCAVMYRLTEISEPSGYLKLEEPILFSINEDGSVTVENHPYAYAGASAYNIVVCNRKAVPLPITGGNGITMYCASGIFLMLTAVCVYIKRYLRKRRYR